MADVEDEGIGTDSSDVIYVESSYSTDLEPFHIREQNVSKKYFMWSWRGNSQNIQCIKY